MLWFLQCCVGKRAPKALFVLANGCLQLASLKPFFYFNER
jgi:hypothetical protein